VRVVLPASLRTLAGVTGELRVEIEGEATMQEVLDALEASHPVLGGTLRDRATGRRRAFIRFFACEQDLSHEPLDTLLPAAVASGTEPVVVVAAIAGG
jgi:hypothetical protein